MKRKTNSESNKNKKNTNQKNIITKEDVKIIAFDSLVRWSWPVEFIEGIGSKLGNQFWQNGKDNFAKRKRKQTSVSYIKKKKQNSTARRENTLCLGLGLRQCEDVEK